MFKKFLGKFFSWLYWKAGGHTQDLKDNEFWSRIIIWSVGNLRGKDGMPIDDKFLIAQLNEKFELAASSLWVNGSLETTVFQEPKLILPREKERT
jgi:hypothetical protein